MCLCIRGCCAAERPRSVIGTDAPASRLVVPLVSPHHLRQGSQNLRRPSLMDYGGRICTSHAIQASQYCVHDEGCYQGTGAYWLVFFKKGTVVEYSSYPRQCARCSMRLIDYRVFVLVSSEYPEVLQTILLCLLSAKNRFSRSLAIAFY
jgi:hypothetical protein